MNKLLAHIILVVALAFSATAFAQQPEAPTMTPPADIDVSKAELQKFVVAQSDIDVIRKDFALRLEQTEEPAKAQQLQAAANEKMTEAVEDAGLGVQDFNRIASAIQKDPELQQRVREMIE